MLISVNPKSVVWSARDSVLLIEQEKFVYKQIVKLNTLLSVSCCVLVVIFVSRNVLLMLLKLSIFRRTYPMSKCIDLERIGLFCIDYQHQELEMSWDSLELMELVKQLLYKFLLIKYSQIWVSSMIHLNGMRFWTDLKGLSYKITSGDY